MTIEYYIKQTLTSESPGGLVETQVAGPHSPHPLVSIGLGWSPRICISNTFPGDADPAGPGATLSGGQEERE